MTEQSDTPPGDIPQEIAVLEANNPSKDMELDTSPSEQLYRVYLLVLEKTSRRFQKKCYFEELLEDYPGLVSCMIS